MSDPTPPAPKPEPTGDDKYVTRDELQGMFDGFLEKLKTLGVDPNATIDPTPDPDDDDPDDWVGASVKEIEAMFERRTQEIITALKPKRSAKTVHASDPAPTPKADPEPVPTPANHKTVQERLQQLIFGKVDAKS